MPGSTGAGGGYGFDLGDLFGGGTSGGGAGGGLGDLLGGVFGRRSTQQRPRRGADVETETSLTFSDAIDGATVSLHLAGEGPCQACTATGATAGTGPRGCPPCRGTGQGTRHLGNFPFSEACKACRRA